MDASMRMALLIDADNAPASKIDVILAELARHGVANVRRAYGNWKSAHLQKWEQMLHPHAIQPVQQFAYSIGKNASDMAMVVDAMDLLHSGRFDAFAIVSSDADFTPLVMRLRSQNMRVFGFGAKQTPPPFINACSTFLYLDDLGEASSGNAAAPASKSKPKTSAELRQDTALVNLLLGAVDSADGDDGWARLGPVGQYIANRASFDPRNYGYPNLSSLIEAIDLFEVRRDNKLVYVRNKPKSQPTSKPGPQPTRKPARKRASVGKPGPAKPAQ
ncbi:MAG: NYN domain-containing protein [Pseudomonadota bacterium]|nr:NYN domain-containing protein [Pseudomonadota bacterium]MDQ3159827.1 NYN domain-containing protein [Pseudomonadota bacterium]